MKAWGDNRRGHIVSTPPVPMQGSHWLPGDGGGAAGAQCDSGSKEGREAGGC